MYINDRVNEVENSIKFSTFLDGSSQLNQSLEPLKIISAKTIHQVPGRGLG